LVDIDIEFVKSVAVAAGDRAVKMIADIQPEYKADNSFVTHIDKETEQFIRGRLRSGIPILRFRARSSGALERRAFRCGRWIRSTARPIWCTAFRSGASLSG